MAEGFAYEHIGILDCSSSDFTTAVSPLITIFAPPYLMTYPKRRHDRRMLNWETADSRACCLDKRVFR